MAFSHCFACPLRSDQPVWLLGNLARATYVGSTNFMWPFSYNECDPRTRLSQEISACDKVNHFGLDPYRGRGAPEIDIIEAMQGDEGHLPNTFIERPYQSCSLQVAPGVEFDRPLLGHRPHKVRFSTRLRFEICFGCCCLYNLVLVAGSLVRKLGIRKWHF